MAITPISFDMERGKITFFCQRGRVHFNLRYVNKYMHEHELNRVKSFVQHGTTQTLASSLLSPNTLWVFKKWPNRIRNSVVTVDYDWLNDLDDCDRTSPLSHFPTSDLLHSRNGSYSMLGFSSKVMV